MRGVPLSPASAERLMRMVEETPVGRNQALFLTLAEERQEELDAFDSWADAVAQATQAEDGGYQ